MGPPIFWNDPTSRTSTSPPSPPKAPCSLSHGKGSPNRLINFHESPRGGSRKTVPTPGLSATLTLPDCDRPSDAYVTDWGLLGAKLGCRRSSTHLRAFVLCLADVL